MMNRLTLSTATMWTAFLMIGCGGEIERAEVSGKVLVDSQPLKVGQIRFMPKDGTKGPSWSAWIQNGEYTTRGSKGTPVGELRIEIFGYRPANGVQSSSDEEGGGIPQKQFLPEKFNIQSELSMTIESGAGAIEKNWELTSK